MHALPIAVVASQTGIVTGAGALWSQRRPNACETEQSARAAAAIEARSTTDAATVGPPRRLGSGFVVDDARGGASAAASRARWRAEASLAFAMRKTARRISIARMPTTSAAPIQMKAGISFIALAPFRRRCG